MKPQKRIFKFGLFLSFVFLCTLAEVTEERRGAFVNIFLGPDKVVILYLRGFLPVGLLQKKRDSYCKWRLKQDTTTISTFLLKQLQKVEGDTSIIHHKTDTLQISIHQDMFKRRTRRCIAMMFENMGYRYIVFHKIGRYEFDKVLEAIDKASRSETITIDRERLYWGPYQVDIKGPGVETDTADTKQF